VPGGRGLDDPARAGGELGAGALGVEPVLVLAHQLERARDGLGRPARARGDEREVAARGEGLRDGADELPPAEPAGPQALEAALGVVVVVVEGLEREKREREREREREGF
jgi:hypothetical protein